MKTYNTGFDDIIITFTDQNLFESEKHKKMFRSLNHFKKFFTLVSGVSGCVSSSAFASLLNHPVGIPSSAERLKICTIAGRLKKYK